METHSKTGTDAISKLTRNCNLFCPPSVLVGNEWRCNMFKNFRHSEGHGSRGLGQQARWYCRPLGDSRSHRIEQGRSESGRPATSSGSIGSITWTRRFISIGRQQKQLRNGGRLPKPRLSPEK